MSFTQITAPSDLQKPSVFRLHASSAGQASTGMTEYWFFKGFETPKGEAEILWLAARWLLWFSIVFIIAWTLRILAIGRRIKALIPEPEKKKFIIVRHKIIS